MAWAEQNELMAYCDTHHDDKPENFQGYTFTEEFYGPNKRDVYRQAKQAGWVFDYLSDGTPRARCVACVKNPPVPHPSRVQEAKQGEQP